MKLLKTSNMQEVTDTDRWDSWAASSVPSLMSEASPLTALRCS